jgi:CofH subfamily radical SAM domain protein
MAVQLARLSLWLATLAADRPLTFLDHHLGVGDSLVGASPPDLLRCPAKRARRPADPRDAGLFDRDDWQDDVEAVLPDRLRVALEPADSVAAVRDKERTIERIAGRDGRLARWKQAADLWCACWFWDDERPPSRGVYFDLLDAVKAAVPVIHIHAFSPMEILNGATKLGISFREFLAEAKAHGLGSIPGTAAEILDDDVRWLLTKGKLPADTWEEIVKTAHRVGIPSSSTIMFGHVDAPPHWVFHIRRLARIQRETRGFTEFVPLTFIHQNAPIYLAGRARPGATFEENRRMHAIARILLDGEIDNIQVSWVKLGIEASQVILNGGANDLGGTLMEETISRMAGAEWGIRMEPWELQDAIRAIGRVPVERTTTYERLHHNGSKASHERSTEAIAAQMPR